MAPVEVVAPKAVHRAQDGVDLRAGEQFAGRSGSRRREQASAAVFRQVVEGFRAKSRIRTLAADLG